MSLATRCTECGTVFRVVQDQLKVSEGWVRCGRCTAVFNALENLCELDGEPADTGAARLAADGAGEDDAAADTPVLRHRSEPAEALAGDAPADHEPWRPSADEPVATEAPPVPEDDLPAAIVSFSSESLPDDQRPPQPPTADAATVTAASASASAAAPAADAPRFVRAAERAAYWRRPAVRTGLVLAALLLAVTLALQLGLAGRDWLAAHLPASRPALEAACRIGGCTIQPLKRIGLISVESSGLARLERAALYRLSVVLRNRADTAVAVPAIDLSVTDGAGQLVARRALLPADLGLPAVIEPGQELPLQATLSTGERRISGYTVELFYP